MSDTYIKNKEFWLENLKGSNPISIKNASSSSHKAKRSSYLLSEKETSVINDFCKQNNISAYVLFLTVFTSI